ncbi:hypothetical protein DSO57_1027847 [Entomophthora muscae]|uniref:Uncharacterized protein n=1 Tax=Entomophthora muscae TaxID=34485 RepID=A0ACC2TP50_9FUNG|nr:hypothetical protein DSO57_1027847 [Entomophthora muscae]
MTPSLTPRPDCSMETPTAAKTMSTQLFGVLYITLTGMVDTMVPNSGTWSLLGQSVSYIIKLAPILWWALPSGLAVFLPKPTNASTYAWLHDSQDSGKQETQSTKVDLHQETPLNQLPFLDPVATESPASPANVYYNTQGALNKLPLDVSNVMD